MKRIKLITEAEKKNILYPERQDNLVVQPQTELYVKYKAPGEIVKIPKGTKWFRNEFPMEIELLKGRLIFPVSCNLKSLGLGASSVTKVGGRYLINSGLFINWYNEEIVFKATVPSVTSQVHNVCGIATETKASLEERITATGYNLYNNSAVVVVTSGAVFCPIYKIVGDGIHYWDLRYKENLKNLFDYIKEKPSNLLLEALFIPCFTANGKVKDNRYDPSLLKSFTLQDIETW